MVSICAAHHEAPTQLICTSHCVLLSSLQHGRTSSLTSKQVSFTSQRSHVLRDLQAAPRSMLRFHRRRRNQCHHPGSIRPDPLDTDREVWSGETYRGDCGIHVMKSGLQSTANGVHQWSHDMTEPACWSYWDDVHCCTRCASDEDTRFTLHHRCGSDRVITA
jgi:hypothetical protein